MDNINFQKLDIVIIDIQPLFREGLKRVLEMEKSFNVIAEGKDVKQLLHLYEQHRPDIVLIDIDLYWKRGLKAIQELLFWFPQAKVLIFTTISDFAYASQALLGGASGYLMKELDAVALIDALKATSKDGFYLPAQMTSTFIDHIQTQSKVQGNKLYYQLSVHPPYHILSKREVEILQLLGEGHSNKNLAALLYISEKTVKNHVSTVLRKMEVRDRTQAVVSGLKNGWIELK